MPKKDRLELLFSCAPLLDVVRAHMTREAAKRESSSARVRERKCYRSFWRHRGGDPVRRRLGQPEQVVSHGRPTRQKSPPLLNLGLPHGGPPSPYPSLLLACCWLAAQSLLLLHSLSSLTYHLFSCSRCLMFSSHAGRPATQELRSNNAGVEGEE